MLIRDTITEMYEVSFFELIQLMQLFRAVTCSSLQKDNHTVTPVSSATRNSHLKSNFCGNHYELI